MNNIDNRDTLDIKWLLGHDNVENFMTNNWRKDVFHVQRNPDLLYDRLISLADIDTLIAQGSHDRISLVHDDKIIMPNAYDEGKNTEAILEFYRSGATIILDNLEKTVPSLRELGHNVLKGFNWIKGVFSNVYLTPKNAQAFELHSDWQDVFILQVDGSKHWSVYEGDYSNPLNEGQCRKFDSEKTKKIFEGELEPGDLLYVPRGFPHEVKTTDQFSLHITLTVVSYTAYDFMNFVIEKMSDDNQLLRKSIDTDRMEEEWYSIVDQFGSLYREKNRYSYLLKSYERHINEKDHNNLQLGIQTVEKYNQVNHNSVVVKRNIDSNLMVNDNCCKLIIAGAELEIQNAQQELEFILSTSQQFKINDIPGSSLVEDKVELVSILLEEKLLDLVLL